MTKKKHCIKHSDKCINHETRQIRKTRKSISLTNNDLVIKWPQGTKTNMSGGAWPCAVPENDLCRYCLQEHPSSSCAYTVPGWREQPPRGPPWVSGLVGHFVQTWPDSESSHTVQCLDCSDLNWRCNRYHLFWHGMTLLVLMCR